MRCFPGVRAHLGVLRLPAMRRGLRVSFSMCGARARLSSSRSRGSTWVLALGMPARARSHVSSGALGGGGASTLFSQCWQTWSQ